MTQKKSDMILLAVVIVSYICYFISTLARANFWIDIFSPVTVIATSAIIIARLPRMGRYWKPSLLLAIGIMFYSIADIFKLLGLYVLIRNMFDNAVAFL